MTTAAGPIDLAARFNRVDTWVFDLDNTLYPAGSNLWPQIDDRISMFVGAFTGLDLMSSRALQKYYYRAYGTTLNGLMAEHAIPATEFLDFVHDIDRSDLAPDHALAAAIGALPGRRLILTNGSRAHAIETARQLGLLHLFEDIFDIVSADFLPKPAEDTYLKFFRDHDVEPTGAAMFEDIVHNLAAPHKHGMATTLVIPKAGASDHREAWEISSQTPTHVDFVTDDLAGFLRDIIAART